MPHDLRSSWFYEVSDKRESDWRPPEALFPLQAACALREIYHFHGPLAKQLLWSTKAAVLATLCIVPLIAKATPLSSASFTILASRCAPTIPIETLESVARTESGLETWALHDDTTGQVEKPASVQLAVSQATKWIERGESVDIGLMQINSTNLGALGMTVTSALDPCTSLAGSAAILDAAYGGGNTSTDQQASLLIALSRYNTGSPLKGIMNGYVRTVLKNAGDVALTGPMLQRRTTVLVSENESPSWDVSAEGTYVQTHGASWLIDLEPSADGVISPIISPVFAHPQ